MEVTNEQLDFYKKEGYVLIPKGLTADDLEPLIQDHNGIVDEIARNLHQQGKVTSLYEGEPFERRLARLVERRRAREPVSRIVGRREFWGLEFAITRAVLDPRPDSEALIEAALAVIGDAGTQEELLDLMQTREELYELLDYDPTADVAEEGPSE